MGNKPRKVTDSIISTPMAKSIFGVGGFFTLLLLGILLFLQHADVTSLTNINFHWGKYNGLSAYELSLFFTTFVMLQFWNMFNAKAFMTNKSAFANLKQCRGFLIIALVILLGQILIVELGGQMFNVTHLHWQDWLIIICSTSLVLWIGEIARVIKSKNA